MPASVNQSPGPCPGITGTATKGVGEVELKQAYLDFSVNDSLEVFGQPPAIETLWLTGELQPAVRAILEHDYPAARVRYWRAGQSTA